MLTTYILYPLSSIIFSLSKHLETSLLPGVLDPGAWTSKRKKELTASSLTDPRYITQSHPPNFPPNFQIIMTSMKISTMLAILLLALTSVSMGGEISGAHGKLLLEDHTFTECLDVDLPC